MAVFLASPKIFKMRNLLIALSLLTLSSCDQLAEIAESYPTSTQPTKQEIANGLREALRIGAQNSVTEVSQTNGFYSDPAIKIPFPPEAEKVAKTARDLGLGKQVDQFVETMNHGAEKAAERATPIFVNAIKQLTIRDVYDIWRGGDHAATDYLRNTTTQALKNEFRPEIKQALDQVELTRYWNPLISAYNSLPLQREKINPNLDEYVLERTMDGLFLKIAEEEEKIRENPQARVTQLLRKVFGYLDNN